MIYFALIFSLQIILKIIVDPGLNYEFIHTSNETRFHYAIIGVEHKFNMLDKLIGALQMAAFLLLKTVSLKNYKNIYLKTLASTFLILSPGVLLNSIEGIIFGHVYNVFGLGIEFSCNSHNECGKWVAYAISLGDLCIYLSSIYLIWLIFTQPKNIPFLTERYFERN